MFDPPHPGETIREDISPALGMSITQAAALNQRSGILAACHSIIQKWLADRNIEIADKTLEWTVPGLKIATASQQLRRLVIPIGCIGKKDGMLQLTVAVLARTLTVQIATY